MLLLPTRVTLLLLCWLLPGSAASSSRPCTLCYDQNSPTCHNKRLISLDDLQTRDRISELHLSYNHIPTLTDHLFRDLGFTSLKRIHCKQCGISSIEPNTFQGVHTLKFLHLSSNNILELHSETFRSVGKLRTLDLNDNMLTHITALHSIRFLQYCYLSDNFITSLRNETFCSLDNCHMITLDLSKNQISIIEQNAFKGLNFLQDLNLSLNNIQHLGNDIFVHNIVLHNLNLQENRIHKLDFMQNIPWVRGLDISFNNISILVNDMIARNTSQLRWLNLANNNISIIEMMAFRSLENLMDLDLSHNYINIIQKTIFQQTLNLETVKLQNNLLSTLEFIGSIRKLRVLHLAKNRITTLSARTFVQTNVDTIDLADNQITTIQEGALQGMTKLFKLILKGNKITHIPSNTFERTHMSDLDLKHNEVSELNFVLHGLSFRHLHLQSNNLSILPDELFFRSKIYTMNEINLSNCGITAVKPGTFHRLRELKTLNLSKNRIHTLSREVFQNTTSLITLNLDYNQLSDVSFVQTCHSLTYLYLESNRIIALPNVAFFDPTSSQGSNLEHLNLEDNEINIIEDRAFQGMPHLKELLLSRNRITILHPVVLQNATRLRVLDVSHNILSQIDFVPYISNLRRLYISNNDISVLPPNAFSITNNSQLFEIDLANNEITTIDEIAFRNLKELTVLNLSGNNITYIYPKSFQDAVLLKFLDLSHNNISEIYVFDNIPWLKSCDLSNNIISILPNHMISSSNTSKLCRLNLANNHITTVEYHAFNGLFQLKELDLSGNNITTIHPQTFTSFMALIKLDLSKNTIYNPDFIQNMPLLRHLQLAGNKIHTVENNTFSTPGMSQLILLNLSHNRISKVEVKALQGLQTLKYLDLSSNYISSLPSNVFENNYMLSAIDMSTNHLSQIEFIVDYLPNLHFCNLSSNDIWMLANNTFGTSNVSRLKYIDLSNNNIALIEHTAFHHLPKLEHLDLSSNNMSYFYSDILVHSPKLKTLDLRNNPTNTVGKDIVDLYKLSTNTLRDIMGHYKTVWTPQTFRK